MTSMTHCFSPYIQGMKDSGCIVAINNDPSAPIFNIADYGIIGDAEEVLGQLVEAIKEAKLGGNP